jgi:gluconate:H+ symporter, GntP family
MEFYQAAALLGAVWLVGTLTARANLPVFLSLLLGALTFAILARMTLVSIGDVFSLGFAQTVDSFGFVIVAGSVVAVCLERSGMAGRFASDGRRLARHRGVAAVAVGLLAGLAPSPTAALALLRPWCRVAGGPSARTRAAGTTTLALALAAGQAFIYPSVVAVATSAILRVGLLAMLGVGIPLAVVAAVSGRLLVSFMARQVVGNTAYPAASAPADERGLSTADMRAIVVPTLVPLVLLIVAAFTQIPSEPFGRTTKEILGFMTRPTIILVLSLGLTLLMLRRWDQPVVSETGWLGAALTASARPLLVTGTAGGFAALLQATGMAELIAERISELHLGLAVPFLAAAAVKVLQGSPLVATLTAAGMTEPLLTALGLDDAAGRAFAAGAIGAGTLIAHVNDPYFWLVADIAELTPVQALALHTLGTVVQACVAVLLLTLVRGFVV